MKEIIGLVVSFMYLFGAIGFLGFYYDLKNDFDEYYKKIKDDPDPKHLNDYFEELANDLVNLIIDEIEDTITDEVIDTITQD